jgi:hypothetical protein
LRESLGRTGGLNFPLGIDVDQMDRFAGGRLDGTDPGDGLLRANSVHSLEDCDVAREIKPARAKPIPGRNVARREDDRLLRSARVGMVEVILRREDG